MRLLITGAGGQLGQALLAKARAHSDWECTAADSKTLNITDRDAVRDLFERLHPDVVINAAAYTKVDLAEAEPEKARSINVDGSRYLAQSCQDVGARLIHVSTDFVFDGTQSVPYAPQAPTCPLGVYGLSKRDGELAALDASAGEACIVRTAWVYGLGGKNFVSTMLRLLAERDQLGVVMDQLGTPTSASSLATALLALAEKDLGRGEILHWTDAGIASWYDFACAIKEFLQAPTNNQKYAAVQPIYTSDYPTPAARPGYSVLDCRQMQGLVGEPRHWREELKAHLQQELGQ
ncbi:MAG: dTDP-4-dehydrorhamnose reductase [Oceanococcus sp.]